MKRRFFFAALLSILVPVISFGDGLKDIEGTWKISEAEAEGKKIDLEELKVESVKITGDRYEVTLKDGKQSGSLKLDTGLKPQTMDVTPADGQDAGKVIKAIYEVKGDTLRVCYVFGDGARPTDFSTTTSGTILLTYKREKKEGK